MAFEIGASKNLKSYKNEDGVTDVVIPENVISIGQHVFSHNHEITSVIIHKDIKKIIVWAFL